MKAHGLILRPVPDRGSDPGRAKLLAHAPEACDECGATEFNGVRYANSARNWYFCRACGHLMEAP